MTGLKKLALATAIAAAPFAQAELTSIDDSVLSEMTGQSGISIELSAEVSIGAINYTDDGVDLDGIDADVAVEGTLGLNNIVLGGNGGTAVSGALDEIKIDIDVDGSKGLVIHLGGTDLEGIVTGSNPVDFGLSVGDVEVNNLATLASDIYIGGNLGPIDVVIANDSTISVDAYFEVTSGSMNVDVMGMGISNLTIGQDSRPFIQNVDGQQLGGPFTSTAHDVATSNATTSATAASAAATITDDVTPGIDDTTGFTLAETQAATYDATYAATYEGTLDGVETAVGGTGLSNMAYVGMTISTASTDFTDKAGVVTDISNALSISIDSMSLDIAMDVSLGGNGIGNVQIDDLNLSGTTLKIYGH